MENHSRPMGEEQALRPEPCFRSKLTALLPATDMSKRTVLLRSHCSMHMDEVGERVQLSWPQGHAPVPRMDTDKGQRQVRVLHRWEGDLAQRQLCPSLPSTSCVCVSPSFLLPGWCGCML